VIVGDGPILLIGESPAAGGVPEGALTGVCGHHLANLCGLEMSEYERLFARTNIFDVPGAYSREGAILVTRHLVDPLVGKRVILLGSRVVAAFGQRPHLFQWRAYLVGERSSRVLFSHAPHPSGRSRFWNDQESVERARTFWEATAAEARRLSPGEAST